MTGLNEKKEVATKSLDERKKHFEDLEKHRQQVTIDSMNGPKIRYESSNNPERFLKYLREYGIPRWERLSQKGGNGTNYAKRMLEKTQNTVSNFSM